MYDTFKKKTTPEGFEPSRAKPNGLAGRRLNHSAKVSQLLQILILSIGFRLSMLLQVVPEPMAQWQRVGFQTRRLGVRIPLASVSWANGLGV